MRVPHSMMGRWYCYIVARNQWMEAAQDRLSSHSKIFIFILRNYCTCLSTSIFGFVFIPWNRYQNILWPWISKQLEIVDSTERFLSSHKILFTRFECTIDSNLRHNICIRPTVYSLINTGHSVKCQLGLPPSVPEFGKRSDWADVIPPGEFCYWCDRHNQWI